MSSAAARSGTTTGRGDVTDVSGRGRDHTLARDEQAVQSAFRRHGSIFKQQQRKQNPGNRSDDDDSNNKKVQQPN